MNYFKFSKFIFVFDFFLNKNKIKIALFFNFFFMLFSFKNKLGELKSKLTQMAPNEPISKLAFVAIIFLDIFILITIFTWLEDHTKQLATLEDYIPYNCRDLVIGADQKTPENKVNLLKNYVVFNTPFAPSSYDYNQIPTSSLHPVCGQIKTYLDEINLKNSAINDLYTSLNNAEQKRNQIQNELDIIKSNYDTQVLEKIANMESDAIKTQQERSSKTDELASLNSQIKNIQTTILANDKFKGIWDYITWNNAEKQKLLESDFAIAEFWYPIKKLFMELAFLLPLFIVFWIWNSRSIAKNSWVQSLISSHLLVIAFIPIFWKILETIFDIIPKRLIEKILEFLVSFKLLAIWYYILVLVWILVWILVVYIIQKKIFSRDKLDEKRLSNVDCWNCWKHLPPNSIYCPFCGAHQFKNCPKCKKETPKTSKFCTICGFKF